MRKNFGADLRRQYPFVMQAAFILALLALIAASRAGWSSGDVTAVTPVGPEPITLDHIIQTKHIKPPPPPRPVVPIPVSDDAPLDQEIIEFDSEPDPDVAYEPPPRRPVVDKEEDYSGEVFDVVERMPEIIGGPPTLHACIRYPEVARIAGIQGTVIVQFVVDEQGRVAAAEAIRGPQAGLREEALRCIEQLTFTPGMQRDRPVSVRMTIPVQFRLRRQ